MDYIDTDIVSAVIATITACKSKQQNGEEKEYTFHLLFVIRVVVGIEIGVVKATA